jgi:hypothetical protein
MISTACFSQEETTYDHSSRAEDSRGCHVGGGIEIGSYLMLKEQGARTEGKESAMGMWKLKLEDWTKPGME